MDAIKKQEEFDNYIFYYNYDTVINKFDWFFKVTRNVIFEHAHFNCQVQLEEGTVEQFIIELYILVQFCNYRELTSEMNHDRLVVGIHDRHPFPNTCNCIWNLYWKRQKGDLSTQNCTGSAEHVQRSHNRAFQ